MRSITCILFLIALGGCERRQETAQLVRPVLFKMAEPLDAASAIIVGDVQPRYKTDYSFRSLGRLIARPVNVGDIVEKGQLLATTDAVAAELAVRSALAELSSAQGQFTNASGTTDRQRTLIETGATTKANLDNAEQGSAAAKAAVARAESNLIKAREQLGYTRLSADYAGVVTAVGAETGQVVSPGQAVITVARPDVREAVIDVSDELANTLRIGMRSTVSLQIDPQTQAQGTIREISPQADASTRTRRVRITLEAPPEMFRLGTTVTASLPSSPVQGVRLPTAAILESDGKAGVWIVDPPTSTVTLRQIQIKSARDAAAVVGGVGAGERIVIAGVHQLKEGQKVRLEPDSSE